MPPRPRHAERLRRCLASLLAPRLHRLLQLIEHAEQVEPYALPGYLDKSNKGGSFLASTDEDYRRVVTLTFQHGASRARAVDNLNRCMDKGGSTSQPCTLLC